MGLELILGKMVENIRVVGLKITWITWEYTHGLTADAIWANIKMIRNTATAL